MPLTVLTRTAWGGATGVWLKKRKIAAIGVRARSWITFHGMAFNVTNELEGFEKIVPCGLADAEVTSLQQETTSTVNWKELENCFVEHFQKVFLRDTVEVTRIEMERQLL